MYRGILERIFGRWSQKTIAILKMKNYSFILLTLLSCCESTRSNKINSMSDKIIALNAAEKKWKEVYRSSEINKQKPFAVEKK